MTRILLGDFVVERHQFGFDIHEAVGVSEKCFWHVQRWAGKDGKPRKRGADKVIFSGSETVARKLMERIGYVCRDGGGRKQKSGLTTREARRRIVGSRRERTRDISYPSRLTHMRPERGTMPSRKVETEAERLSGYMGAIFSLLDDEIAVRFRTSSHRTEEELGKNSSIYHLLSVPRNMARSALDGKPFLLPSPQPKRKARG